MKIKLILNEKQYALQGCLEIMCLLGIFLEALNAKNIVSVRQSILDSMLGGMGNIILINFEDDNISLSYAFSEEDEEGTEIVIPKKEFFHILDEWEKVCKERPQEVTIIREGDAFRFEKMF